MNATEELKSLRGKTKTRQKKVLSSFYFSFTRTEKNDYPTKKMYNFMFISVAEFKSETQTFIC